MLLGIDPDQGERIFQRKVNRTEQRLAAGHKIVVHGRELDESDVARALHLTANEDDYVAERLLAHSYHEIDLSSFQAALEALEHIAHDRPEELLPLAIGDLSLVTELLPAPPAMPDRPRGLTGELLREMAGQPLSEDVLFDL